MQIILMYMLTQAYIFMIKRIPRGLNIFNRENKRCGVSVPVPGIRPSLSRDHKTIAIMNHEG